MFCSSVRVDERFSFFFFQKPPVFSFQHLCIAAIRPEQRCLVPQIHTNKTLQTWNCEWVWEKNSLSILFISSSSSSSLLLVDSLVRSRHGKLPGAIQVYFKSCMLLSFCFVSLGVMVQFTVLPCSRRLFVDLGFFFFVCYIWMLHGFCSVFLLPSVIVILIILHTHVNFIFSNFWPPIWSNQNLVQSPPPPTVLRLQLHIDSN